MQATIILQGKYTREATYNIDTEKSSIERESTTTHTYETHQVEEYTVKYFKKGRPAPYIVDHWCVFYGTIHDLYRTKFDECPMALINGCELWKHLDQYPSAEEDRVLVCAYPAIAYPDKILREGADYKLLVKAMRRLLADMYDMQSKDVAILRSVDINDANNG